MKRKFVIEVDIDTDRPGTSIMVMDRLSAEGRIGQYRVVINSDRGNETDALPSTAHEIGHVLALEFDMPKTRIDPRVNRSVGLRPPVDVYKSLLDSEIEAWDIAALVLHFNHTKLWALSSYQKAAGPPTWIID